MVRPFKNQNNINLHSVKEGVWKQIHSSFFKSFIQVHKLALMILITKAEIMNLK